MSFAMLCRLISEGRAEEVTGVRNIPDQLNVRLSRLAHCIELCADDSTAIPFFRLDHDSSTQALGADQTSDACFRPFIASSRELTIRPVHPISAVFSTAAAYTSLASRRSFNAATITTTITSAD